MDHFNTKSNTVDAQTHIAEELDALRRRLTDIAAHTVTSKLRDLAAEVRNLELAPAKIPNYLNQTHFKILNIMHEADVPITCEHLSVCLGISARTVAQYMSNLRHRFDLPLVYRIRGNPKRFALHYANVALVCKDLDDKKLVHSESFAYSVDVHTALKKVNIRG